MKRIRNRVKSKADDLKTKVTLWLKYNLGNECNSHDIYKEEFFDTERNGWVS